MRINSEMSNNLTLFSSVSPLIATLFGEKLHILKGQIQTMYFNHLLNYFHHKVILVQASLCF